MKAAVIESGFDGMSVSIRLQSAGIARTILEGRDKPGGRAYVWEKQGFTFDAGPTVITDPDCLEELWRLSGRSMASHVELMPVPPFYRLYWQDGSQFDYSNDDAQLEAPNRAFSPADVCGYRRFLAYSANGQREGY